MSVTKMYKEKLTIIYITKKGKKGQIFLGLRSAAYGLGCFVYV